MVPRVPTLSSLSPPSPPLPVPPSTLSQPSSPSIQPSFGSAAMICRGQLGPRSNNPSISCIVIAQDWPCWAPVVQCCDISLLGIFSQSCWEPYPACQPLPSFSDIRKFRVNHIFISGSWNFVAPWWHRFRGQGRVTVALDQESSPPPHSMGRWVKMNHCSYGGLSDGVWWLGSSALGPTSPGPVETPAPRCLLDILSSTQKGIPFDGPFAGTRDSSRVKKVVWVQGKCSPFGLMPVRRLDATILSRSVFGKRMDGGALPWVCRQLTLGEVLQICDLPADLAQSVPSCSPADYASLPMVVTPPTKLLLPMCRLIVENLIGKEFPTPQSSRKVSFSDKIKVIPWVWAVSAETSGSGLDNEPAVRPLICFENEEGDGRQKAAKDDDAGVDYLLWDNPFWDHLRQLGRSLEFIQGAKTAVVGRARVPLLTALREWILRLWRRTVYLSLQRYLKLTYYNHRTGCDWQADVEAGIDCLSRVAGSDFWDWCQGSRLFFWR